MRGLFANLARETKSDGSIGGPYQLWEFLRAGSGVKAGVSVSLASALRVSVVLACARVISEGVAQIPFKLYRSRIDGGADPATDLPLYKILWRQPNDWMTSFEFRETLTLHAVLTGNGFAYKNRVRGRVAELIPMMPAQVKVCQAPDYSLAYELTGQNGQAIGTVGQEEMLHLRGPSWNGVVGLDMIREAREAIGLAIATEETHSRFHANGARPSGILSPKNPLSQDQVKDIKASWDAANAGVDKVGKTAMVPVAMEYKQMVMTGVDAQHLETRRFQIEEVCRNMRVFPMMVMQSDKTATFASAEQFFIAHVIHTLAPWVQRWEEVADRDLVSELKQPDLYSKMSVKGLLRGDSAAQATFYERALGAARPETAYMLRNEVRELEELNPVPGWSVPVAAAEAVVPQPAKTP